MQAKIKSASQSYCSIMKKCEILLFKKKQTIHVLRPLSHWKSEISILQKVYCSAFYRCFRQFCNCIGYQKQINVRLFPFLFQIWQKINTLSRRPFLEASPEMFSHLESHSKISNLVITELFYSHIFNMNRGSLHIRRLKCIHLFVYTKWPLRAWSVSGASSRNGVQTLSRLNCSCFGKHLKWASNSRCYDYTSLFDREMNDNRKSNQSQTVAKLAKTKNQSYSRLLRFQTFLK